LSIGVFGRCGLGRSQGGGNWQRATLNFQLSTFNGEQLFPFCGDESGAAMKKVMRSERREVTYRRRKLVIYSIVKHRGQFWIVEKCRKALKRFRIELVQYAGLQ
jgi:hypothetical protein